MVATSPGIRAYRAVGAGFKPALPSFQSGKCPLTVTEQPCYSISAGRGTDEPEPLRVRLLVGMERARGAFRSTFEDKQGHSSGAVTVASTPFPGAGNRIAVAHLDD